MGKSFVMTGSAVLGIAAVAISAAPANAAVVTNPCTTEADHVIGTNNDNFYMDCVPQYGLGKAEFTVTSDTDFPPGFVDLTDPSVTRTSNIDSTAAQAYFGETDPPVGFIGLTTGPDAPTSTTRSYSGGIIYRISGVERVDSTQLPAGCGTPTAGYEDIFRVTYLPTTVTFTQTIDGQEYSTEVTSAPEPLVVALTVGSQNFPICVSSGAAVVAADPEVDSTQAVTATTMYDTVIQGNGNSTLSPFTNFDADTFSNSARGVLGVFTNAVVAPPVVTPPVVAPPAPVPAPAAQPQLAATGFESTPASMLGAGLLLIGGWLTIAVASARRRRKA